MHGVVCALPAQETYSLDRLPSKPFSKARLGGQEALSVPEPGFHTLNANACRAFQPLKRNIDRYRFCLLGGQGPAKIPSQRLDLACARHCST